MHISRNTLSAPDPKKNKTAGACLLLLLLRKAQNIQSPPPRFPPLNNTLPRTFHFPIRAPPNRGIVAIQHPLLTFIRLAERIPPLFPHTLHLAHFPDGFLELFHARSVVLDIVFLDFLDVVVRLRAIHALRVFPGEIAEEAEGGEEDDHEVEDWGGEELGDDALVFGGHPDFGGDGAVDG